MTLNPNERYPSATHLAQPYVPPETPAQFWQRFSGTETKTPELLSEARAHYAWHLCACCELKDSRRDPRAIVRGMPLNQMLFDMGGRFSMDLIRLDRWSEARALFDEIQVIVRAENELA